MSIRQTQGCDIVEREPVFRDGRLHGCPRGSTSCHGSMFTGVDSEPVQ